MRNSNYVLNCQHLTPTREETNVEIQTNLSKANMKNIDPSGGAEDAADGQHAVCRRRRVARDRRRDGVGRADRARARAAGLRAARARGRQRARARGRASAAAVRTCAPPTGGAGVLVRQGERGTGRAARALK